jgi:ABC-type glycerol-3-phosphate transport system permease component
MIRTKNRACIAAMNAVLVLSCLVFLFPIAWMILTSLKSNEEILRVPPTILPDKMDISKYEFLLFSDKFYLKFFLNSLIVAGIGTLVSTLNSIAAGFCFAKINFRGSRILFFVILSTLMIPFESYMIPLFSFIVKLKMLNTYKGLIFPIIVSSFGIFLMTQYMRTIPDEMIEAARIDGASIWKIFMSIVVPLSVSSIMLLAIFQFMTAWGDFIWPLIITKTQGMYVMELGLTKYRNQFDIDYSLLMSASMMAITPVLVVFLFFKRYIIESTVMTGLKA